MLKLSRVSPPSYYLKQLVACLVLFCAIRCLSQTPRSVLCRDGNGVFDAEFRTGVRVHIGATRNSGVTLAGRTCAAKLSWGDEELTVATDAAELDLDAFGADFGDGTPVAAFQVRNSSSDCCVEYRIYSLTKPPRLLRTLSGGEYFNASDVDLDGRIEIWTNDAAAVNGFESLTLGELDSAPTVVLRFAHRQLTDVSAEFVSYFDQEIGRARNTIRPEDLEEFKHSDGQLREPSTPTSAERLHRLRKVKVKVLEIVWAHLYSGREREAWNTLAELWPASDIDRIRGAIGKGYARGIHGEAESNTVAEKGRKHARIFDAISGQGAGHSIEVIPPQPILLEFPQMGEIQGTGLEGQLLDLVIDAAGKVRSVEPAGKSKSIATERIAMASGWKFIPAMKDDRAVASRMRISVSPKQ